MRIEKHFLRLHPKYALERQWELSDRHFDDAGGQPLRQEHPDPADMRTSRELATELMSKGLIAVFILAKAQDLGATVDSINAPLSSGIVRRIRRDMTRTPKTSAKRP